MSATALLDAMTTLRQLANRATESAADPQAVSHPDLELLNACDNLLMLLRLQTEALAAFREGDGDMRPGSLKRHQYDEYMAAGRRTRGPLRAVGKLRATTPAGIFAKALVIDRGTDHAAEFAKSLARDLLASPELRAALWPAPMD